MNVLLVEPDYYSKYPPLGLMKLFSFYKAKKYNVQYVRGTTTRIINIPDIIEITSLFTYAWKSVHNAIRFYHQLFPNAEITIGGIYATLMSDHIKKEFSFVKIHKGLHKDAENYVPSYYMLKLVDKWKDWNKSIIFTSRGCIRKCPFCMVPKIEGSLKINTSSILNLINRKYKKVIIWDNNFLASPYSKTIMKELINNKITPDFNQGLDARLMNKEIADLLVKLKPTTLHFAYDWIYEKNDVKKTIELLSNAGYLKRNIIFYVLYNFYNENNNKGDTLQDFLIRLKNLMIWGASAYPMRYIPLNALDKNKFISPNWNLEQLESIATARRVMGFGGTFVPYKKLVDKIINSTTFEESMKLNPIDKKTLNINQKILYYR